MLSSETSTRLPNPPYEVKPNERGVWTSASDVVSITRNSDKEGHERQGGDGSITAEDETLARRRPQHKAVFSLEASGG